MRRVSKSLWKLTCLIAITIAGVAGCHESPREIVLSGPTMGTLYNIRIAAPPAALTDHDARTAVDAVLSEIDRSMSTYRADSEISRFNAAQSTDWIPVSADLAAVVTAAQQVSEASGGALDITVAPLVNLWGFGPGGEPAAVPDADAIAAARAQTGYRLLDVRLTPAGLRKQRPSLQLDLNAVAPGFAVDKMAMRFAALGLRDFMIDIGGEVLARGRNVQGDSWHIAVEKPFDDRPSEPLVILRLPELSVTTSGEYRHYYRRDGHRYSHTIDPRTGRPVEHALAAVVLIGPTSLGVDAWATALNVLGEVEGLRLAQRRGMSALFVSVNAGKISMVQTKGFTPYVIGTPP